MNNWKIYCHISPDGQMYIGQTHKRLNDRFGKNGIGYCGQPKFYEKIVEYGWNSFTHICLMDNLTSDMADIIERELIKKYDTINNGFNSSPGGKTVYTDKYRVFQYSLDGNFIREYESVDDAVQENSWKSSSGIFATLSGKQKSSYGYLWSYDRKDKIQPYNGKRNEAQYKRKVYQYGLDGKYLSEYESISQVSEIFKGSLSTVSAVAGSEHGSCFGYQWRYYKKKQIEPYNPMRRGKGSIYMYDKDTKELLDEFYNIEDAKSKTGIKSIGQPIRGGERITDAGGYLWSHEKFDIYPYDHSEGIQKDDNIIYYQYDSSGRFLNSFTDEQLSDYCRENNYKKADIKREFSKLGQVGGYIWSDKYQEIISPIIKYNIGQFNIVSDQLISIYSSTVDAYRKTGVQRSSILRCCKGERKTAGGYIWKYIQEDE